MATVLITGCSRGLGLEAVRQFLADGWKVFATCRDSKSCSELDVLKKQYDMLEILDMDIADNTSIDRVASVIAGQPLDLLVQNAGVYGPTVVRLGTVTAESWMDTLRVNTIAPLMLVQSMLSNLRLANDPTIVLLSSKMGSITDNNSGGGYIYRSSKTALNSVGKSLAEDLREDGIKVLMIHPGWVKTDMGGPNALIDAATSVASIRRVIEGFTLEESGSFLNYDGKQISW